MGNFLERLEIEMEKSTFSFLLVFFIIFIGIDIVTMIMISIQNVMVIFWYIIPLFLVLIIAGVIIDKRKRAIFLLLLIPEGFLTLVLGFVTDPFGLTILWVFIGVFSGFTIVGMLAYFSDVTSAEQRGRVAGFVLGVAWMVAAVILSWLTSTVSLPGVLMFVFAIIKLTGGVVAIYLLIRKTETSAETSSSSSSEGGFMGALKESYGFLWSNPTFRVYLVTFILIWLAQGIFLPFGGIAQASTQIYQSMASIGFLAGGFSLIIGSYMLDRGRKQMIVLGSILTLLSILSYYFTIGAVCLAGIPLLITTVIVVLADIAPADARGRFYSVFFLFNFLAFFTGFLVGWIIAGDLVTPARNDAIVIVCIIITGLAVLFNFIWGKESSEDTDYSESRAPSAPITAYPPSVDSPSSIEEKTP